jgi:hypothetical protein
MLILREIGPVIGPGAFPATPSMRQGPRLLGRIISWSRLEGFRTRLATPRDYGPPSPNANEDRGPRAALVPSRTARTR